VGPVYQIAEKLYRWIFEIPISENIEVLIPGDVEVPISGEEKVGGKAVQKGAVAVRGRD
jgi:hypothetical protein